MIIALTGPTGSGKTEIAVELAKAINGEVVNADAFQVYQELSIATAKPTKREMDGVPHHLFDFVPLDKDYDVATYQADARKVIDEVLSRGKNVILAGGTGLYIRAALFDFRFDELPKVDMSKYESMDDEELYECLLKIDEKSALATHKNNRIRVMRALEIYEASGIRKSDLIGEGKPKLLYEARFFEIDADREPLYERVEKRVDEMFEAGLLEETVPLIEKYGRNVRSFNAIGVKELFPFIDGQISLEEAKTAIKDATRHYIKRQETFFRHQFEAIKVKGVEEILKSL